MVATANRAVLAGGADEDNQAHGHSCQEWVAWLAPAHYSLFMAEVAQAAMAKAPREEMAGLLDAWRATAELDHAPDVQKQIERNRGLKFLTVDEWRATNPCTA